MPFSVAVLDEVSHGKLTPERATKLCAAAFSIRGFNIERLGEISVALVDIGVIHKLNLQFRKMDSPTDVLSFDIDGPYGEMVGEIVVAPEYVRFGRAEVEELVVHGALHIAGMTHGDEFAGSEMAGMQAAVLGGAGVSEG